LLELFGPEATRRPSTELPPVAAPHPWAAKTEPVPPLRDVATRESVALVRPGPTRLSPELAAPTQAVPALETEPTPTRAPRPLANTVLQPEPVSGWSQSQVASVSRKPSPLLLAGALLLAMAIGAAGVYAVAGQRAPVVEEVAAAPVPAPAPAAAPPTPVVAEVAPTPAPALAAASPTVEAPDAVDAGREPRAVSAGSGTNEPVVKPAPGVVAAATSEAPAVVAKTGRVNVVVMPWAEVRLGGRVLGITPMDPVELPRGAQTLTLVNSDLGVTRTVQVKVPAGGTTTVKVDLMAE
jgi:hypothetical protein